MTTHRKVRITDNCRLCGHASFRHTGVGGCCVGTSTEGCSCKYFERYGRNYKPRQEKQAEGNTNG